MKMTPVQDFRLSEAQRHAQAVLIEFKQRSLKGKDLEQMKELEEAVQKLDIVRILQR